MFARILGGSVIALSALLAAAPAATAQDFSIDDVLSPAFPYDLVAAPRADRIAWLSYERGRRNVYTALAPGFEPQRLTAWEEDDGHDLSGLQISDDGALIAFLRGHTPNRDGWVANPASDAAGAERAVWAMHTAGGAPWRVTEARSFALSPDGRWVAFERDGHIHAAPVSGDGEGHHGDAGRSDPGDRPLFSTYGRNSSPVWSPDGRRLAFVSNRDDHAFIGVFDLETRRVSYLAPGVDRDSSPTWSPDGSRVAFIRRPGLPFGSTTRRTWDDSLSLANPGLLEARFAGGHDFTILSVAIAEPDRATELWRNTPDDERFSEVRSILWAGEHILFRAEPGEWEHWFAIAEAGTSGAPIHLTPGEGFVEHAAVSPDGRWLYYAANIDDIDRRQLWRVPTSGGAPTRLTGGGDEIYTFPAVLPGEGRVAALYASSSRPQSVALLDVEGDARVITDLPARFPAAAHVVPENVVLTSPDGVEFHNQLFLPPDMVPGEQRPALIFIHGGPRRQMLLGYNYGRFYHMAYAMNQYFANQGYVVLSVNYRAGIGYGRSFRTAPEVGRNGSAEYQDIRTAGLYLRDRGDVDPARIGLWGLSYGGILTAQGLARDSDLFAAGVDIAGVHLWGDPLDFGGTNYLASSASEIANWRSPVLLIHGDDDRNVAFSQTVGLVQLLRGYQVPFELIVFPDEVHDFLIYDRWVRSFEATDDFFDRVMLRGEPARTER